MKIPLLQRRTLVPVNVGFIIVSNTGEKRSLIFGFEEFYKTSTKLNSKELVYVRKVFKNNTTSVWISSPTPNVKASIEDQCRR